MGLKIVTLRPNTQDTLNACASSTHQNVKHLTLLFHKCFIYKQLSHMKYFLETAVKQTLEDQNCSVLHSSPLSRACVRASVLCRRVPIKPSSQTPSYENL